MYKKTWHEPEITSRNS